ncbi:MAG: NEW3 domain-containing protein, partial [Armatimonadota bacterium]
NSIETVEVVSRRPRVGAAEPLIADEREPVQPVYSRYWEHNAGAAPVDNLPVALSLDAVCSRGEVRALRVSVANDFVDATAEGTVQLKAPEGWIVTPEAIRYRLGPGEARTWQITCGPQADATDGIIRAETQHNGQTYYDVVEVAADGAEVVRPVGAEQHDGRGCCLQVAAERGRGSIRVVLHNPHRQAIACAAWVISPLETWPAADVGPYSLLEVTPRIQACVVGPGAEERLSFSVTGEPRDAKWWAVVKVAYNGRVDYKRV